MILGVRTTKLNNGGSTTGLASVTINGCFAVNGLKIMNGRNGEFISMPSKKKADNEYADIFFPITKEGRELLSKKVLEQFKSGQSLSKGNPTATKIEAKVFNIKNPTTSVVAMASITLDKTFVVNGIRVLDGKNGLFIAMPSKKKTDGTYEDVCFPVTKEFREELVTTVLSKYSSTPQSVAAGAENEYEGYEPSPEELAFYNEMYPAD